MDPRAELEQIQALFAEERAEEAAQAIADLWRAMADPGESWRPMRSSFLARFLARAAASGPPARRHVEALRQEAAPAHGPDPADHFAVREWSTLNIALGQADRTLSWLDRMESDPATLQALRPLSGFIPYILRQAGRWPDMARWFPDPAGAVRRTYAASEDWLRRLPDAPAHLAETVSAFARDRTALIYASMLAAGRESDALAAAEAAAALDPEPRRLLATLVRAAVDDAGEAREHQRRWLAGSDDRSEGAMELRERVEAALRSPKTE